ncbi:hypothetical protein DXG01_004198, partial [Tephrocybe rancida]
MVNELIRLRETQNDLKKRVKEYDAIIADMDSPPDEYVDAQTELESVRRKLEELRTRIRRKQAVLGVGNCTRLTNLINNPFLALWMQTLALKQWLHDRLQFCKFELDRLERSFQKQVHDEMEALIKAHKAPPHAICLEKIETKGLFSLDVDDTIWQDTGLDEGSNKAPPPWLANESVHAGIQALLEHESTAFIMSATACMSGFRKSDDESLWYHLGLCCATLCHLCALWRKCMDSLNFGNIATLPPWGPSDEDLCSVRVAQQTESVQGCARQAESNLEESNNDSDIDDSDFEGDEDI